MKKISIKLMLFAGLVAGIGSCKGGSGTYLPPCTGKPGEVLVIIADDLYKGAVGDTLVQLLTQDMPALPQTGMEGAEPMFNLIQLPPSGLTNMVRPARNLIIVDLGPQYPKAEMKVYHDYWADQQILVRIHAPDKAQLLRLVSEEGPKLVQILQDGEVDRYMAYSRKYQNHDLGEQILRNHGILINFPQGFQARVDTGHFVWAQYEPPEKILGVLIWDYPYKSEQQLELNNLEEFTNRFLEPRVPGPSGPGNNSYMQIVTEFPVLTRTFKINGNYVREMRGLWQVKVDFMGGPFVSWTFVDEARNRLVTCLAFVYSPRSNKRNDIRNMEGILKTVNFPGQETKPKS
jgi:hypothetical protein